MALRVAELYGTLELNNQQFIQKLDQAEQKTSGFHSTMGSAFNGLAGMGAGLALGVVGVGAAIGAMGIKAIGMAADMEQSKIAFTTMLGSAKEADGFIKQLQTFAAQTPFTFLGLQENAKRLMAMGYSAKEVVPLLTNVGDAVAALGSGQAGIDNVTYALGQMKTAGKVHTQDLMQLTNAGISAWDMLAKKLGVTVAEAQNKVQKGEVSSQTGIDAIMTGMHAKYGGLMSLQAKTVSGLFSNLQDITAQAMITIGQKLTKALNVGPVIAKVTDELQKMMAIINNGGSIVDILHFIMSRWLNMSDEQIFKLESALKLAWAAVVKIYEQFKPFIKIVMDLIAQHPDVFFIGLAGVVGGLLVAAFAALAISVILATWPILLIALAIGALVVAGYLLYSNWGKIIGWIKTAFADMGGHINGVIQSIIQWFESLPGKAVGWGSSLINSLVKGIQSIHIPMPHFSLTGGFDPAAWAVGKDLPGLNVSWWARGAVFDRPTLFGAGEAGREVLTPEKLLDQKLQELVGAVINMRGGDQKEVVNVLRQISDKLDPPPGGGTGDLASIQALVGLARRRRSQGFAGT